MRRKKIKLSEHERIVAVVPEYCAGPGWANAVLWVYVRDASGNHYRVIDIQPEERTTGMHTLFAACAAAHSAMLGEVMAVVQQQKS